MLYLKDKQAILFRDSGEKYRPVSFYKGANKITGYEYSEVTGETLNVSNTYNDTAKITINGKTVEVGTGTKSPSNPYTLSSVANFDLLSCAKNLFDKTKQAYGRLIITIGADFALNTQPGYATTELIYVGANKNVATSGSINWIVIYDIYKKVTRVTNVKLITTTSTEFYIGFYSATANNLDDVQVEFGTVATPYTQFRGRSTANFPHILRSLPNGDKDIIIIDNVSRTAKLYKNIESRTISGASVTSSYPTYNYSNIVYARISKPANYAGYGAAKHYDYSFSHATTSIATSSWDISDKINYIFSAAFNFAYWIGFPVGTSLSTMQTILDGSVLHYKLATPVITDLDYADVLTYYPQTQIYTTATVQPELTANIRIISA